MKLILNADVEELGKKGDVVDVADGYARNYLLPRSLGVKASGGNLKQAEAMREARIETERRAREEADRIKDALTGTRVVIAARAGDEGKLFGSIGPGDVAQAIKTFVGLDVPRSAIVVQPPIRAIGLHEVTVRTHPEVEFQVALDVVPA
jgi:large subunit ribosomal protein L9